MEDLQNVQRRNISQSRLEGERLKRVEHVMFELAYLQDAIESCRAEHVSRDEWVSDLCRLRA